VEKSKEVASRPEIEIKEVPVFTKEEITILKTLEDCIQSQNIGRHLQSVLDLLTNLPKRFGSALGVRKVAPVRKPVAAVPRPVPSAPASNGDAVSGGLRRMMIALAQRPGLNKRQLGVRAGLSSTSGTFGTYLTRLRSSGWIEGTDSFQLTDAGLQALGEYHVLPEGQELLSYWLNQLGNSGASRMLRVLADAYPRALTKEELGEAAQISSGSGTFGTYLTKLRTLELIEGRSELTATKEFFE
ncbi:MAG TPA: hypothetical protein VGR78_10285, partial [Verrucomicrobiae bacterium]|nr:hypothetical protein [Verrucomicrobiae bacterium]